MKRLLAPFLLLAVLTAMLVSSPGAQAGPGDPTLDKAEQVLLESQTASAQRFADMRAELAPGAPVLDPSSGQPVLLAQNEVTQPSTAAAGGTSTPAPSVTSASSWYDSVTDVFGKLSLFFTSLATLIGLITAAWRRLSKSEKTGKSKAEAACATVGVDILKILGWIWKLFGRLLGKPDPSASTSS